MPSLVTYAHRDFRFHALSLGKRAGNCLIGFSQSKHGKLLLSLCSMHGIHVSSNTVETHKAHAGLRDQATSRLRVGGISTSLALPIVHVMPPARMDHRS